MARKSKKARQEARLVWQGIRQVRDVKVAHNLANPMSELLAPNIVKFHKGRMDLGRAGEHGARARVSQLIIRNDPVSRQKGLEKKFKLNDNDLYSVKLDVTGGSHQEPQVRTGTTKSRLVIIEKDGERIAFRTKETGKFSTVGLPGSVPKDGGK